MITFIETITRLDNYFRRLANVPCQPMRVETDDDLEIERPEPIEDEREYGNPVGDTSDPFWPYRVS